MYLTTNGLVSQKVDTTITYAITPKGQRLLSSLKIQQRFRKAFDETLRPPSGKSWDDGRPPVDTLRVQLSGNDHRLLFGVYKHTGMPPNTYEKFLAPPVGLPIDDRIQRLKDLGLSEIERGEIHLTPKGRDLVEPVKIVAEHVYGPLELRRRVSSLPSDG